MVQIDGMDYDTDMSYDQMISVVVDDLHRTVNPDSINGNVNMYAMIDVSRVFHSGDVSMYDNMMYAENRTVSAHCIVAILPKRE